MEENVAKSIRLIKQILFLHLFFFFFLSQLKYFVLYQITGILNASNTVSGQQLIFPFGCQVNF